MTRTKHQNLPLYSLLVLGVLTWCAAENFLCCMDVIRYTVPALPAGTEYWKSTNLMKHILEMPVSAQRYFLFHSLACGVTILLCLVWGLKNLLAINRERNTTK